MITSLPKKFKSAELHEQVVAKIPSFMKVRSQLTRARRTERHTANQSYVPDASDILTAIGGLDCDDDSHALNDSQPGTPVMTHLISLCGIHCGPTLVFESVLLVRISSRLRTNLSFR